MPAPTKSLVTIPDEAIKRLRSLERLVGLTQTKLTEEQITRFGHHLDYITRPFNIWGLHYGMTLST